MFLGTKILFLLFLSAWRRPKGANKEERKDEVTKVHLV